ncbi:triosephosphate isomerase [Halodesulfurarchaeum formicicum]|uniref:Triosephosphate isomerase n=1 Tax=Halodesulfurarchaeum formicicum TaxID=1873524 RepID=A0A1D8S417_9EURY|nr:triose-phosphate isomerase [Halodesulfurarchaeum formicicum]AOW80100.1 triosephosphate isomerase [Halodesulfurarchaeum formicicum]
MFVLVNLKAYDADPIEVASAAADVNAESDTDVAIAPQTADLAAVADTGAETWAQHTSPVESGSHTGQPLAEGLARNGAVGTLINHSERRLSLADIDGAIAAAERAGLETVVCANNPHQIAAVAALGPDAVAIEPPELIGTGTPVSQADPAIVRDAVEAAESVDPDIDVYCGAGISTAADVEAAADLGADGVLLASGVAKADDPATALQELIQ